MCYKEVIASNDVNYLQFVYKYNSTKTCKLHAASLQFWLWGTYTMLIVLLWAYSYMTYSYMSLIYSINYSCTLHLVSLAVKLSYIHNKFVLFTRLSSSQSFIYQMHPFFRNVSIYINRRHCLSIEAANPIRPLSLLSIRIFKVTP